MLAVGSARNVTVRNAGDVSDVSPLNQTRIERLCVWPGGHTSHCSAVLAWSSGRRHQRHSLAGWRLWTVTRTPQHGYCTPIRGAIQVWQDGQWQRA